MYPFYQNFNEHLYGTHDIKSDVKITYENEGINRIIYVCYTVNLSQSSDFNLDPDIPILQRLLRI